MIKDRNSVSIGRIKYSIWKTEAEIQLNGENFYCKTDGFFSFSVIIKKRKTDSTDLITLTGSSQKGEIQNNQNDSKLILCAMYLMNYYIEFWVSLILMIFFIVYLN